MLKRLLIAGFFTLAALSGAQADTAKATAANPAYAEGATAPLSQSLSGYLRVMATISGTVTVSVTGTADVNCVAGCAGGTFNNNADNVATSATNGQSAAWAYVWDGSAWDRLYGDSTNGAFVNVKVLPAIPAGSNIIGNVRIDQTTPGTTNGVQINAAIPAGANIIGALSANQSVNVAQFNGVTPLMGAGNSGTGSQRVSIATDDLAHAAWGQGAVDAAAPAGATMSGARSGANIVAQIQASASAAITMSSATTTQFVALSGSTKIYITSFDVIAAGTTNVTLVYGTGSNCGTGTTALTGVYTLTAQAGIAKGSGMGPVLVVPAGNAFCVTNSQAIVIGGSISYTQF